MASTVGKKTIFGVQSFSKTKGGVAIDLAQPANNERAALRLAERLSSQKIGVIAFSRSGDPEVGEYDAPVVLMRYGEIPFDLEEIFSR